MSRAELLVPPSSSFSSSEERINSRSEGGSRKMISLSSGDRKARGSSEVVTSNVMIGSVTTEENNEVGETLERDDEPLLGDVC